jgi:hypothetical protein
VPKLDLGNYFLDTKVIKSYDVIISGFAHLSHKDQPIPEPTVIRDLL